MVAILKNAFGSNEEYWQVERRYSDGSVTGYRTHNIQQNNPVPILNGNNFSLNNFGRSGETLIVSTLKPLSIAYGTFQVVSTGNVTFHIKYPYTITSNLDDQKVTISTPWGEHSDEWFSPGYKYTIVPEQKSGDECLVTLYRNGRQIANGSSITFDCEYRDNSTYEIKLHYIASSEYATITTNNIEGGTIYWDTEGEKLEIDGIWKVKKGSDLTITVNPNAVPAEVLSRNAVNSILVNDASVDFQKDSQGVAVASIKNVTEDSYVISANYEKQQAVLKTDAEITLEQIGTYTDNDTSNKVYTMPYYIDETNRAAIEHEIWDLIYDEDQSSWKGLTVNHVKILYYGSRELDNRGKIYSPRCFGTAIDDYEVQNLASEELTIKLKSEKYANITAKVSIKLNRSEYSRQMPQIVVTDGEPIRFAADDDNMVETLRSKLTLQTQDGTSLNGVIQLTSLDGNELTDDYLKSQAGNGKFYVQAYFEGNIEYRPISPQIAVEVAPHFSVSDVIKEYTGDPCAVAYTDCGNESVTEDSAIYYYDSTKKRLKEAPTNVGEYYYQVHNGNERSNLAKLTINQAVIPVENILANTVLEYNGKYQQNDVLYWEAGTDKRFSEAVDLKLFFLNWFTGGYYEATFVDAGTYSVYLEITIKDEYKDCYQLPDNYIQYSQRYYITVNPKKIIVSEILVADKVYDGTKNAAVAQKDFVNGLVGNEKLNINITGEFESKTVGNNKNVNLTFELLNGSDGGKALNYTVDTDNSQMTVTATIHAKPVIVEAKIANKQFDGTNTATYEADYPRIVDGVIGSESVSLKAGTGIPTFNSAEVGENIAVDFGPFELEGEDAGNYTVKSPIGVTADIYNNYQAVPGTDYTVNSNDWMNDIFVIRAADKREISTMVDGTWGPDLSYSEETATGTDGTVVQFFVKNTETGAISKVVQETYRIDTTLPTGEIKLGNHGWKELLDKITFNMFFNENQTVEVIHADKLSGVAKVELLESARGLSQQELIETEESRWIEGDSVEVTAEDLKQFVYYARITDNAGNVTYLSSDGAEFDLTAPKITGVEDGAVYYVSQVALVEDKNLDKITLNGQEIIPALTFADEGFVPQVALEGNKDTTYTIVATDKAGNSTTVSVVMQPVAVLDDTIDQMEPSKVTSEEKGTIQSVLDQLEELLKDEDITEAEKAELEEMKKEAEALKTAIEKAEEDVSTEEIKKVEDLDNSNVKLEDKSDIQAAKDALEQALKDNAGNYTEAEKTEIQKAIIRLESAAASIEKAEAVLSGIHTLPESADTDMAEEEEEALLAVQEAYNALSEHERSMISEKDRTKLETLLEELTAYEIIEGDGSSWTKGSDKTLTFVANGAYRKYRSVGVNSKQIIDGGYTVEEGSTVVKLKPSYLETLSEGEYTITIQYTDGEAEGTFTVKAAAEDETEETDETTGTDETEETDETTGTETQAGAPATGDETNLVFWSVLMGMSVLGMAVLLFGRRRKSER